METEGRIESQSINDEIKAHDRYVAAEACAKQLEQILTWLRYLPYAQDGLLAAAPELHLHHAKKLVEWIDRKLRDGDFLEERLPIVEVVRTEPITIWFVAAVVDSDNQLGPYLVDRGAYLDYDDALEAKNKATASIKEADREREKFHMRCVQLKMPSGRKETP